MSNALDPVVTMDEDTFYKYLSMTTSAGLHCRLPAIVNSYDRDNNIVVVRPAIKIANYDGTYKSFPLFKMPVQRYGGGNYHVSVALEAGDTGDIVFFDRDISRFLKTLLESEPATMRLHAFEDCEFQPKNRKALESGSEGFLITNDDGNLLINLLSDKIIIKNSTTILTVNENNVNINTNFEVLQNSTFTGAVAIGGGLSVSGGSGADVNGTLRANELKADNGATGSFNYVTVKNGIVTGGHN